TNQWIPKSSAGAPSTQLAGDLGGTISKATVMGLQNRPVSATAPADGQSLTWNASTNQWIPQSSVGAPSTQLAGDIGGMIGNATVTGLQNRPVSATAPTDGQAIIWSASSNQWLPMTLAVNSGPAGGPSSLLYTGGGGSEYQLLEHCVDRTIPYTTFSNSASSQIVPILTVPNAWSPRLVQIQETVGFATTSTQITALAASVGTLSKPTYYLMPVQLMQILPNISSDSGEQPAQLSAHTLYLQLSVTNTNPGNIGNGTAAVNLTSGVLTVTVCGVALQ
ncbi:MAG TPA: hypothetical protein VNY05_34455, partial [Candidatus Acidoferrales bacterium]|nr:hypothetical protein [Candidatus Acidoferrales bacterium]